MADCTFLWISAAVDLFDFIIVYELLLLDYISEVLSVLALAARGCLTVEQHAPIILFIPYCKISKFINLF